MTDSALAEFSFVKSFFHAEDSALFNEIFRDVCKYVARFGLFSRSCKRRQLIGARIPSILWAFCWWRC